MSRNALYIIDTSSLIDMNLHYPMSTFKSVWRRVEELIIEGRLVSSVVVFDEIIRKDDTIKQWADRYNDMLFQESTQYVLEQVGVILKKFPKLINPNSESEQADPFLIAMALDKKDGPQQTLIDYDVCIVTEEKMPRFQGKRSKKIKIPEVCQSFNIPCISLVDMIVKEGWEF